MTLTMTLNNAWSWHWLIGTDWHWLTSKAKSPRFFWQAWQAAWDRVSFWFFNREKNHKIRPGLFKPFFSSEWRSLRAIIQSTHWQVTARSNWAYWSDSFSEIFEAGLFTVVKAGLSIVGLFITFVFAEGLFIAAGLFILASLHLRTNFLFWALKTCHIRSAETMVTTASTAQTSIHPTCLLSWGWGIQANKQGQWFKALNPRKRFRVFLHAMGSVKIHFSADCQLNYEL